MPIFEYSAISSRGKNQKGHIEADSIEVAKERLILKKLMVTSLKSYQKTRENVLSPAFVLSFTRDLAQLLKAGLPLYDSLLMIEEKYRDHKSHLVFLTLCDYVKHGMQLSDALKYYPKSFDGVYVAMVAAGERSARLDSVFDELAQLIQRASKLKKQLTSAMIYPAFIGAFCLIVISVLLFFLVPSMAELFEGRALHPMTSAVLAISGWLTTHSVLFATFALGLLSFAWFFVRADRFRPWRDRLSLKLPWVKEMVTQAVMVRFCRTLSRLLDGGVPLLEALQHARGVMQHGLFEKALKSCEDKVAEGQGLSEELGKHAIMPKTTVRMLAIAEEAGNVPEMLGHIADFNSDELEKNLSRLSSYLQPVILMALGVIVGVILLAVLLPLTDVNSFLDL